MIPHLLLLALVCAATVLPAHGQLAIAFDIKRRTFLRYEPLVATVRITNLSGRDLMLHDDEQPWFGFDVKVLNSETTLSPRNPDYRLDPLEIKIGETVKRTVDLTQLFALSELGEYKIKATIFAKPLNQLFSSKPSIITIVEGKVLWHQTVGVPDTLANAGQNHTIKLLEFPDDKRYLYVRVEDEEQAYVFCTRRLGHMIDGTTPQLQLDTTNNLYVLHLIAPKTYLLTNIGVNGEWLGQYQYTAPKAKPFLRRIADGSIQLVGAHRDAAQAAGAVAAGAAPPKISDRPPGLPSN